MTRTTRDVPGDVPSPQEVDRRLTEAFADLANRATAVKVPAPAGVRRPTRRLTTPRRFILPGLAAVSVMTVLLVVGLVLEPDRAAGPDAPAPTVPTPAAVQPSPSAAHVPIDSPSQSEADAARDGVLRQIAALPLATRLAPTQPVIEGNLTDVTTAEGVWVISKPRLEAENYGDSPCVGSGSFGVTRVCSPNYGDILLLDADRSRILRAYPFPSFAPTWLLPGEGGTLYCGRSGDGAEWQSMACRIDGRTGKRIGRVFPNNGVQGDHWITPSFIRQSPGIWQAVTSRVTTFLTARLTAEGLVLTQDGVRSTVLDPKTLGVVQVRR